MTTARFFNHSRTAYINGAGQSVHILHAHSSFLSSLPRCYYKHDFSVNHTQGWTQRGCLRGGTSSQRVELSGEQAVSGGGGGEYERGGGGSLIEGGPGGGSPGNFLKSMSLRMHFKPF